MPGDCFSQTLIETVYRRAHQNHPINYVIFSRQMLSSFMLPFSRWSDIYGRTGRLKIFEGKLQCNRMMFPFKPFLLQQLLSIAINLISCPYRTVERVLNMHLLTISQLCEKMYYEGFILRTFCDFVRFNFSFFFKVKKKLSKYNCNADNYCMFPRENLFRLAAYDRRYISLFKTIFFIFIHVKCKGKSKN